MAKSKKVAAETTAAPLVAPPSPPAEQATAPSGNAGQVTMIAITRVGYGGGLVALPGQEFPISAGEAERLEKAGAAKKGA